MDDDGGGEMMIEDGFSDRGGVNQRRDLEDGYFKRREVVGGGGGGDEPGPSAGCGAELLELIFGKLEACSLVGCCLVCREWFAVASSDKIWAPKCQELWLRKAHIPRMSEDQGIPKMAAYSLSVMDSERTRITWHDLCDNAWEFHFTEAAPEYWRNLDPHWSGTGPAMRRYFKSDGTIAPDAGDPVWGGHESCYTIVTGLLHDGKIREHYVRINKWPKLSVRRRPDWGWELSNHLFLYSSVPDGNNNER